MKKTAALFAAAGALVVGALALDLWYTFAHRAPVTPTPSAVPLTQAPPPTDPTARPSAASHAPIATIEMAEGHPKRRSVSLSAQPGTSW